MQCGNCKIVIAQNLKDEASASSFLRRLFAHIKLVFVCHTLLNFVECLTELNIASKKVLSLIIWGFVDFGNELSKMTYLPTNFEMELTLLSEIY